MSRKPAALLCILLSACNNLWMNDQTFDADGDGLPLWADCNDDDPLVRAATWYKDADGDGFAPDDASPRCAGSAGMVQLLGDCDDAVKEIHPNTVWYTDGDGDRYGDPDRARVACVGETNEVLRGDDCDDQNKEANELVDLYQDLDEDGYGSDILLRGQCGTPSHTATQTGDCDDNDVDVNPATTWYKDNDGDGFGAIETTQACDPGVGWSRTDDDCDDGNETLNPNTVWYRDFDGDGHGNPLVSTKDCESIDGYVLLGDDCDDGDDTVFALRDIYVDADGDGDGSGTVVSSQCGLLAYTSANSLDCDDNDNELNSKTTWYRDADGDGYGLATTTTTACSPGAGWSRESGDCNDRNSAVNLTNIWYADLDGDTYGDAGKTQAACAQPTQYVSDNTDCDDSNGTVNPFTVWALDQDGDGVGDAPTVTQCEQPTSYVNTSGTGYPTVKDCDDTKASVSPLLTEVCDGLDNDCNGTKDEGVTLTSYVDLDGDGYPNQSTTVFEGCSVPIGYAIPRSTSDCDDSNSAVHPLAYEACDGVDNDCDTTTPDGAVRTDQSETAYGYVTSLYYPDIDGNDFGETTEAAAYCPLSGYVPYGGSALGEAIAGTGGADCWETSTTDTGDTGDTGGAVGTSATTRTCPTGCVDPDPGDSTEDCVYPTTTASCTSYDWYLDADRDGFGVGAAVWSGCFPSAEGQAANDLDCNDGDASSYPGAPERCDKVDQDCDGSEDDNLAAGEFVSANPDRDGDGFGILFGSVSTTCTDFINTYSTAGGWVEDYQDCDDTDNSINPNAQELCTFGTAIPTDENCNGDIDELEGSNATYQFPDDDGDGVGTADEAVLSCAPLKGYVSEYGDCAPLDKNDNGGGEDCNCDFYAWDCVEDAQAEATLEIGDGRYGLWTEPLAIGGEKSNLGRAAVVFDATNSLLLLSNNVSDRSEVDLGEVVYIEIPGPFEVSPDDPSLTNLCDDGSLTCSVMSGVSGTGLLGVDVDVAPALLSSDTTAYIVSYGKGWNKGSPAGVHVLSSVTTAPSSANQWAPVAADPATNLGGLNVSTFGLSAYGAASLFAGYKGFVAALPFVSGGKVFATSVTEGTSGAISFGNLDPLTDYTLFKRTFLSTMASTYFGSSVLVAPILSTAQEDLLIGAWNGPCFDGTTVSTTDRCGTVTLIPGPIDPNSASSSPHLNIHGAKTSDRFGFVSSTGILHLGDETWILMAADGTGGADDDGLLYLVAASTLSSLMPASGAAEVNITDVATATLNNTYTAGALFPSLILADLNGNDTPDLVFGAFNAPSEDGTVLSTGRVSVYFDLSAASTEPDLVIYGANANDQAGRALVADFDNDGDQDLAISNVYDDTNGTNAGFAYILWGDNH